MNRLTVAGRAVLVAAMCVLLASLAEAQTTTTGRVEGTIVGADRSPVAGAIVKARHAATDTIYTVESNELGRYTFAALPPGPYEVTVSAPSFDPAILIVQVAMASTVTAELRSLDAEGAGQARPQRSAGPQLRGERPPGLDLLRRRERRKRGRSRRQCSTTGIEPADSVSWGLTLGVYLTRRIELEFLFDRQSSTLRVGGTRTVDVGESGYRELPRRLLIQLRFRRAPGSGPTCSVARARRRTEVCRSWEATASPARLTGARGCRRRSAVE